MRPIRSAVSAVVMTAALVSLPGVASATSLTVSDVFPLAVDGSSTTRALTIAGSGSIADLNFTITFAKCDDGGVGSVGNGGTCLVGGYSYNQEIVFRLTSPGGTIVNLVSAGTYTGQMPGAGWQTVMFDDAAGAAVGGSSIVTGTFRPVGLLSAFNGQEANGIWTLFIQDTVGSDPLHYFSSTLDIETPELGVVAEAPEPATLSLLGLGLGLAGIRLAARKRSPRAACR